MRIGTTRALRLKSALPYPLALRLQRALKVERFLQFLHHFRRQLLHLADGMKLLFVVLLTVGIACTDTFVVVGVGINLIKVVAKILTTRGFHFMRQVDNACFYLARLLFRGAVKAVTKESSALGQMIECTAKHVPFVLTVEVKPAMQTQMTIVIGILVLVVACSLPQHEVVSLGVYLVHMPVVQQLVAEKGAQAMLYQNFQNLYLAQPSPEILPPERPVPRSLRGLRRLYSLLNFHAFLKYQVAVFYQITVTVLVTVNYRPT